MSFSRTWWIAPAAIVLSLASINIASAARSCNSIGWNDKHQDVQGCSLYFPAIEWMYDVGIAEGAPAATGSGRVFLPWNNVNRAEFTKLVLLGSIGNTGAVLPVLPACASDPFPDVPKDEWFAPYVCAAKRAGIISGFPDGTFKPTIDINFANGSKILAKTFNIPIDPADGEFEAENIWYRPYTMAILNKGAVAPTIESFDQSLTRGEMAEMIYRLRTGKTSLDTSKFSEFVDMGSGYHPITLEESVGLQVDPPDPPYIFVPAEHTVPGPSNIQAQGYAFQHHLQEQSCTESGLWEHCKPLLLRWSIELYRPKASFATLLSELQKSGLDPLPAGQYFGGKPGHCYFHSFEGDYADYCVVDIGPSSSPLFVLHRGYAGAIAYDDPNPNAQAMFARIRKSMKFVW